MAKIYQNFSEFRTENKSIFKFLSKSDQRGLHEAIWSARDTEVQSLKKKIEELQDELSLIRCDYSSQNEELRRTQKFAGQTTGKIEGAKIDLSKVQDENLLLKTEIDSLKEENKNLKTQFQDTEDKAQLARSRFEKSLELISQLETHIQRQKESIEELRETQKQVQNENAEAKKELLPLQNEIKELRAHLQLTTLDLEQYKTFYEQGQKLLEQQEIHMAKLKANSLVLKEVSEDSKNDFKKACDDLKQAHQVQLELSKTISELEEKTLNLEKNLAEQLAFTEELKSGIRTMKQNLHDKDQQLASQEKNIQELTKNLETLNASEFFHKAELQKAQSSLEKTRLEKERLANELRWLNNTIRDVQNSLGHIHKQYIRQPNSLSMDQ